jgi:multiple sugar transport system permease protein
MTWSRRILIHSLLIFGALLTCFPFVWMVLTSLKDPKEVLHPEIWVPRERSYLISTTTFGTEKETEVSVLSESGATARVRYQAGALFGKEDTVPKEKIVQRRFHWQNYVTAWNRGRGVTFTRYMWNSFWVSAVTTLGNIVTSLLAAYAFTYFEFPFKAGLFALLLGTMMVPQQVQLVPDFLIVSAMGWYNSYWALIVPWTVGVFGIFLLRQFFMTLPKDLYEAAMIDGCSRFGFLMKILLPLSGAPLATLTIFSFLANWNALLWPLVVTDRPEFYTIQVGLASFTSEAGTRWELLMAASTISILPLVIFYFFAQKQFIESIAQTGIKG